MTLCEIRRHDAAWRLAQVGHARCGAPGRRPLHHLDIGVTLPPLDGVTIQADSLISSPDSWRLYLRARPGWWNYSTEDHSRRSRFSVRAEDDLGGLYLAEFDGYTGARSKRKRKNSDAIMPDSPFGSCPAWTRSPGP